jgi:outer membrane protein assembly factor BamB
VIPEPLPVQSLAATNGLVYGTWFTDFGRAGGSGAFAVHPDTGAIVWTGDLFLLAVTPGVALSDEPITGTLSARNPTTGAVLWQSDQTDPTAAATDQLAFFSYGAIRRLSDGALVGNVATAAGEDLRAVTPANGVVYAASSTKLYAFAPSAG